ncbi:unnamed protein product [Thelazia callipaeda]|uniref:Transmembrane protein 231 n=1 Tax=Thelazia callipaeda TaxID=103827 RepID=A0A0N5CM56_THECL|nr:unnamed protein product [Thelazia callipaeda]
MFSCLLLQHFFVCIHVIAHVICRVYNSMFIAVVLVNNIAKTFLFQGFWKKFGEYREQAAVYYKQRFIVLLKGEEPNDYLVWSSYPLLNHAEEAHARIAVVEEYEIDLNDDEKPDQISLIMPFFRINGIREPSHFGKKRKIHKSTRFQIELNVTFPLTDKDRIHGVFFIFFFDYKLDYRSRFSMEAAIIDDLERIFPSSSLTVSGELWLDQMIPFWSSGFDSDHGGLLINESSLDLIQYNPTIIASRHSLKNFTTTLKRHFIFHGQQDIRRKFVTWTPRQADSSHFVLHLSIRISEQQLVYQTGLLELFKWAWIQYFAFFVVVNFFVHKVRRFLFENHLLDTIIKTE